MLNVSHYMLSLLILLIRKPLDHCRVILRALTVVNLCVKTCPQLKPATHLAILYADRRDRRKSPGVPRAVIAIFADRFDRRIKSLISGMSDIGD